MGWSRRLIPLWKVLIIFWMSASLVIMSSNLLPSLGQGKDGTMEPCDGHVVRPSEARGSHGMFRRNVDSWPRLAQPGEVGYNGSGVSTNISLLTQQEKLFYDQGLSTYQVNQLASDRLPLRRINTLRMPECQNLSYSPGVSLPTVGVVLIFTDEIWSVLLRTVFSILDASPAHLLTEIVLVDDASKKDHLGRPLDEYIKIFGDKVKLVRLPTRKGLIAARNAGFDHVTGDVVVFLDAHCEVHEGWLEPLLLRIQQDDTLVVTPIVDVLSWETFEARFSTNNYIGTYGFQFDMRYTMKSVPPPDGIKRKTLADPIESAAHMGCCLATSKNNFERLGRYDPGLEIWGCENTELSFKTWMCGGRIELIPCSHVVHLYRPKFPYSFNNSPFVIERNCLRVAEVWMDQYKVFYQDRLANLQNIINIGDLSQRRALRESLGCRSFDWYMREVLGLNNIYLPVNTSATGSIVNVGAPDICLEKDPFHVEDIKAFYPTKCSTHREYQYFFLTTEKQIRRDDKCLTYDLQQDVIKSQTCDRSPGKWEYTKDNLITALDTSRCLTLSPDFKSLAMTSCNISDSKQQWTWPRRSIPF